MDQMELDEQLKAIQSSFSNNQKKLFERIRQNLNPQVAIALISLQGIEKTSQAEIEVISDIISQFDPLAIYSFQKVPRHIVLCSQAFKGHLLYIEPQYKVKNSNPKYQPWAIDLVLKLYRKIGQNEDQIGVLGVEYDGHISHYVESKVKTTYQRDISIIDSESIPCIRISPTHWKTSSNDIKKTIKRYFEHKIKTIDTIQLSTIKAEKLNSPITKNHNELLTDTTCPICNGRCQLAREDCPICKGMGSIKKHVLLEINVSDYASFKCPDCWGIELDCSTCGGEGFISREKALDC